MVSLSNGCICCSLEGDLLRTLATLLRRDPRPELIVIETSGVADPTDVVRNLMDPVIWREAPLETVLCVVDATIDVDKLEDALLRSQIRAADVVALSKTDIADPADSARVRDAIRAQRPAAVLVDAPNGDVPSALLFPSDAVRTPQPREPGPRRPAEDRFETLSWTSEQPICCRAFNRRSAGSRQNWRGRRDFSKRASSPASRCCFNLRVVARRWRRPERRAAGLPRTRIVFVAEIGVLSRAEIDGIMQGCIKEV